MDKIASSTIPVAIPGGYAAVMTPQTLLFLAACVFVYYVARALFFIYIYPFHVSQLRHLPTPLEGHHWILGQLKNLLTTQWIPYFYLKCGSRCPESPFIRILKMGNSEVLVPNTITAYREILQTKSDCFVKPSESRTGAVMVIGEGLPWIHGELHRLRRAALNKLFSPSRMKACAPRVHSKVEQMVNMLAAKRTAVGEAVEIESEIWKTTLDIAAIKTMGIDLNHLGSDYSPLNDIFTATMRPTLRGHITRLLVAYTPFREWLPMESISEFARKCAEARSFILGHVQEMRSATTQGRSKLDAEESAVMQAMVDNESLWNDSEVVEHVLNFMILGHDTTACTMLWTLDMVARRTDMQDRIRAEIMSLKELTWTGIDGLHYLDNFLRESLRFYCPVQWIPSEAACDVDIAGVAIPKGTRFNLVPAMMNYKPEIWGADVGVFDPDRWDRLTGDAGGAYSFATFHNGPRVCIGKALTFMEMKLMIVELVSRFRLETTHEDELEIETPSFTLKPKDTVKLRLMDL